MIPHLYEHKKYCLHYRNLKCVKSLGVEIGEVHIVVIFTQEPWMKPYIEFNTNKRKDAKNEFEKDFFKLMNNAVFGKTMENVKNRANIHATTSDTNAVKWFSKMTFKNNRYFRGLYLIENYKTEIIYDKPIYVGTSILDLSKLHMMDFHYNVIEEQHKGKYELIYSDTDSFVYRSKCSDVFNNVVVPNKQHFDLSDMQRKHLQDNINKKY